MSPRRLTERKRPLTDGERMMHRLELVADIALQIASAVEDEGITYAEAARCAGVSVNSLQRIMSAQQNATVETLADIADGLGCRWRVELVER